MITIVVFSTGLDPYIDGREGTYSITLGAATGPDCYGICQAYVNQECVQKITDIAQYCEQAVYGRVRITYIYIKSVD
jgi:hypothetical protein